MNCFPCSKSKDDGVAPQRSHILRSSHLCTSYRPERRGHGLPALAFLRPLLRRFRSIQIGAESGAAITDSSRTNKHVVSASPPGRSSSSLRYRVLQSPRTSWLRLIQALPVRVGVLGNHLLLGNRCNHMLLGNWCDNLLPGNQ